MTKKTVLKKKTRTKRLGLPRIARSRAITEPPQMSLDEAEKLVEELKHEEGRRRGEWASKEIAKRGAANRVNLRLTGHGLTPGDHIVSALTGCTEHTSHIDFVAVMAANSVANELDVVHEALQGYRNEKQRASKSLFFEDAPLGAISFTVQKIAARLRAASHLLHDIGEANKSEGGAP